MRLLVSVAVIALLGVIYWAAQISALRATNLTANIDNHSQPLNIAKRQLMDRIAFLEGQLADEESLRQELERQLAAQSSNDGYDFEHRKVAEAPESLGESLAQLGLSDGVIDQIRYKVGQNRMTLLATRDRAAREGWIHTPEYAATITELADPSSDIRSELGDEVYDSYLYATNKPNRVQVTSVYPDSAAESGGVQFGDTVIRYGSENIYSMNDLISATVNGRSGESVLVELQRDGESVFIVVPRGPLGILMDDQRVRP